MESKTMDYAGIKARSFIVYSCLISDVQLEKIMVIEKMMLQTKTAVPEKEKDYVNYFENIVSKIRLNKRTVNKIKKEIHYQIKNGNTASIRIWYRQFKKLMNKSKYFNK